MPVYSLLEKMFLVWCSFSVTIAVSSVRFRHLRRDPLFLCPAVGSHASSALVCGGMFNSSDGSGASLLGRSASITGCAGVFISVGCLVILWVGALYRLRWSFPSIFLRLRIFC